MPHYDSILCCTDFSPNAAHAFEEAEYIASLTGARLWLLHVFHSGVGESALAVPAAQIEAEDAAARERMAREYQPRESVEMLVSVRHGHVAAEILEAAKEAGAGLIVLGARGLTRWEAFTGGGSIADKVVRHALVPVLVVSAHERQPRVASE